MNRSFYPTIENYEIMWENQEITTCEGISSLNAYFVAAGERIKEGKSSTHYYVKHINSGRMERFTHHSEERTPWMVNDLLRGKNQLKYKSYI